MEAKVAVFVDGDNLSPAYHHEILAKAKPYGRILTARVYFDAKRVCDWHKALGYRLIHAGCGKNASDMLLAIDAVELKLRDGFDVALIASSDGDFSHLAQRLTEWGVTVIGLGEQKTPQGFRASCQAFLLLTPAESKAAEPKPQPQKQVKPQPKPKITLSALESQVLAAIRDGQDQSKGILVSELSSTMFKRHGTKISTHAEKNWRGYLRARPMLFDLDAKGPEARVRAKAAAS